MNPEIEDKNTSPGHMDKSGLYEIRMNDFCMNYLTRSIQNEPSLVGNLTRPRCSVSPIDFSANQIDSSLYQPANVDFERQHNESYLSTLHSSPPSYAKFNKFIPTITTSNYSSVSTHDSAYQSYDPIPNSSTISISSPYVGSHSSAFKNPVHRRLLAESHIADSLKKPLQYQSTPNKPITNTNLPEPFSNQSNIECQLSEVKKNAVQRKTNFHSIFDLATSSSNQENEIKINYTDTYNTNNSISQSSQITNNNVSPTSLFNQNLLQFSKTLENKENISESISKVIINYSIINNDLV